MPQPQALDMSTLLDRIAQVLDITENQYKVVEERYMAVAKHLADEKSILYTYTPEIKPQGSFLLGTMIRPIVEDEDLDIDLVCRLKGKKAEWTQADVKKAVGDRLKDDADYKRMLEDEGNRCWTIKYHEEAKFHMDILPAVIEPSQLMILEKALESRALSDSIDFKKLEISITDRRRTDFKTEKNSSIWLQSNPSGYASWFNDCADISFIKGAVLIRESIDPLPNYRKEKYPLLRIVQILKRHRDIMFGGDEDKPISIILTTLAARAYEKQINLLEGINSILDRMPLFIQPNVYDRSLGKEVTWISNPINESENFADKWIGTDKEARFNEWLEKAKSDFASLKHLNTAEAYHLLKEWLGTRAVNEAISDSGAIEVISENYRPSYISTSLLQVSHREQPKWPLALKYKLQVHGRYKALTGKYISITPSIKVPKKCDIFFTAETDVPKPFDVYWQVVNTGEEARIDNGLRGGIYHSRTAGKGGLDQKEASLYEGVHWVECFIIKEDVCVARSSEFFVIIQ